LSGKKNLEMRLTSLSSLMLGSSLHFVSLRMTDTYSLKGAVS